MDLIRRLIDHKLWTIYYGAICHMYFVSFVFRRSNVLSIRRSLCRDCIYLNTGYNRVLLLRFLKDAVFKTSLHVEFIYNFQ